MQDKIKIEAYRIGSYRGEDVYLLPGRAMCIERDHMYLVGMTNSEIAGFVHQELGEKELHGAMS